MTNVHLEVELRDCQESEKRKEKWLPLHCMRNTVSQTLNPKYMAATKPWSNPVGTRARMDRCS